MGIPSKDMQARSRQVNAATSVAYTGTHGRLGPLAAGWYLVSCSTDAYVLQGGSAVAATASSNPLWAKTYINVYVASETDTYISAIQQSAGGTLYATRLD